MARRAVGSSLRRSFAPTGALLAFVLLLATPLTAAAETPSPDPPPLGVAPEPPPLARTQPAPKQPAQSQSAPVRAAPAVVTPAPVVAPAPVVRAEPRTARPKPKPIAKRSVRVLAPRDPHDRGPIPLTRFVVEAEPLDDGLLAAAGGVLLLVAAGGCVVLSSARRLLHGERA